MLSFIETIARVSFGRNVAIKTAKNSLFLSMALIVAGCATPPVMMNASLLEESDASIHIVTTSFSPAGKMYRTGSQGLLDIAINSAVTNQISTFLATKNGSEFNELVDKVEDHLNAKNIPASRHTRTLDYDALPKRKAEKGEFDRDLTDIFSQTDAKYVLLLRLAGYGAARSYYGFIPTSAPSGVVLMDGAIVDRNSKLHWFIRESAAIQPRFTKAVGADWKQPPNYPALDQALTESWQLAEDGVLTEIFGSIKVNTTN